MLRCKLSWQIVYSRYKIIECVVSLVTTSDDTPPHTHTCIILEPSENGWFVAALAAPLFSCLLVLSRQYCSLVHEGFCHGLSSQKLLRIQLKPLGNVAYVACLPLLTSIQKLLGSNPSWMPEFIHVCVSLSQYSIDIHECLVWPLVSNVKLLNCL